jgi:dipeptidase E
MRRTGADKLIGEQIESGKLYIGESTGAIVISSNIDYAKGYDDCAKAPDLTDYTALNAIDFYPCPHHTNQPFKKAVEKIIAIYGVEMALKPISNSQAILVAASHVNIKQAI